MKWLFVAAAAACAACVPASEAAPPAGAFGFTTEPSPATRGEPFVTSDGWTVRVETLVLQVSVSAQPTDPSSSNRYYGSYEEVRFDASQSVDIFARRLPPGPVSGNLNLSTSYIGYRKESQIDKSTEVIGVSPEQNRRFWVQPDASERSMNGQYEYQSYSGPSALLIVRAEKAGTVVTMDLTLDLNSGGYSQAAAQPREVVANELVTVPTSVVAEAFFTDVNTNALGFDDVFALDVNGDGRIDGAELSVDPFFDRFRSRASRIFVMH